MKIELDPDEDEFRPECGVTTQETYWESSMDAVQSTTWAITTRARS